MPYATVKDVQKFLRFAETSNAVARPESGAAQADGYPQVTIPPEPVIYDDDDVLWDSLSDETKQSLIPSFLDEGSAIIDSYLYAQYPKIDFPVTFTGANATKPSVLQFQEQLKNTCAAFAAMSIVDRVNSKNAQEFKTQIQLNWEKRLQFLIDIKEFRTNPPALQFAVRLDDDSVLPPQTLIRTDFVSIERTRTTRNSTF